MTPSQPHWRTSRLKYVAGCNLAVLPEDTDAATEFVYVDIGDVTQGRMDVDHAPVRFGDAPSRARRVPVTGDIAVSTVRTYLRAVAMVPDIEEPPILSTGFAVLHPGSDVERRWFAYYLQSDAFVSRVIAHSEGVSYPAIASSRLMALGLDVPSLDEQRAIADFLDEQTSRIDTLIDKQTQLITTLRERATASISRALEGLTAPRVALRRLGRTGGGSGFPHEYQGQTSQLLPFYKVKALATADRQGVLGDADDTISMRTAEVLGATVFPAGSIVYAKVGAALMLGRIRMLPRPACIDNNLAAFVPGPGIIHGYARQVLAQFPFRAYVNPGAVPSLSDRHILGFKVPLPTVSEQAAVLSRLEAETSRVDNLIDKAEAHIGLAKERRAALITAAATGQIDVRTAGRATKALVA